ncbi:MAG TPA: DinB family protein [Dehalococcoidia bacterium]|nr:DinB family protein [Dehalococcoidia bacterium]
MTRDELLAELRASGAEVLAAMQAVPAGRLESGAYENGWTVRQLLAHLASMEYAYGRLPDLAHRVASGTVADNGGAVAIDEYNARQVARRAGYPVAELADEFARGRARLINQVRELDEALLAVHVRSAGGSSGTLARVIAAVAAAHVRTYVRDLLQAASGTPTAAQRASAALHLAGEEAAQICEAASPAAWLRRNGDDWSAAAIAGHMAELLPYWATQAAEAAAAPGTRLGRDLGAPERLGGVAQGESVAPAGAAVLLRRAATQAASVLEGIPVDAWAKPVPTARFGTISLERAVALLLVDHAREHVAQLTAALTAPAS